MIAIVVWDQPYPGDQPLGSGEVLVCCVFCARVRTAEGNWLTLGPDEKKRLHQRYFEHISHGYCPDCLALHYPGIGRGASVQHRGELVQPLGRVRPGKI